MARLVLAISACLFALPLDGRAATIVSGNIHEVLDGDGNDIGSTVDYWHFTVNSAGIVTIDVLSWEVDWEDVNGNGDSLETIDVNGDGEIAFVDPYIYLFKDDGSLDAGDFVAVNDDSALTLGDGSIYDYDSYLSRLLLPGNYVLAIGAFDLDLSEAIAGFNDETFYPTTNDPTINDGLGTFIETDHGDYRITFDGDLTVTDAQVPEPASLLLLAVGATMAVGVRGFRRRFARR